MTAIPPRILIIVPWFGKWPAWTRLFLESCRANPTINWRIVTDCGARADLPENVALYETGLLDYRDLIGKALGIKPEWAEAYKLCDFKPALAAIHPDWIDACEYWGWGDLDVIYGDIRAIYTPEILRYDVISSHAHVVAGHFTLLANNEKMRTAFSRIRGWRKMLSQAAHCSFDEQVFSRMFLPIQWRRPWRRLAAPYLGGALLQEQYSTNINPLPWIDGTRDYPTEWYWRGGKLTNNCAGTRQFLYLHFSHWQSNRWTSESEAPWRKLQRLDQLPEGRPTAFRISRDGFTPLDETAQSA